MLQKYRETQCMLFILRLCIKFQNFFHILKLKLTCIVDFLEFLSSIFNFFFYSFQPIFFSFTPFLLFPMYLYTSAYTRGSTVKPLMNTIEVAKFQNSMFNFQRFLQAHWTHHIFSQGAPQSMQSHMSIIEPFIIIIIFTAGLIFIFDKYYNPQ